MTKRRRPHAATQRRGETTRGSRNARNDRNETTTGFTTEHTEATEAGTERRGWRLVSENTFMRFPRVDELGPNQRSTENREHVSRALGALRPPRRCERFCEGAFPKPWFNEKTSLNGREELNCLELMSWERTENHAATQRTTPQELPQAVQRKKLTRRVNDRVHRRENRPSE